MLAPNFPLAHISFFSFQAIHDLFVFKVLARSQPVKLAHLLQAFFVYFQPWQPFYQKFMAYEGLALRDPHNPC